MRDEVREKVGENSEQRETGDAVGCQNPSSAAFMMPDGGSRSRGLLVIRSRDDRGPIFHAKTSSGKIVAQDVMRHACPAAWQGKTIWAAFYPGLAGSEEKNVTAITVLIRKIIIV
jgi:hypothetical protein